MHLLVMCWSRWLWMIGCVHKWYVLMLLAFPWKKRQNKLPLPFVQIWISPFLLQSEMCLLPYSNPSVRSSEYMSSYLILSLSFPCSHLQPSVFSGSSYSDMIKYLFIFLKMKECTWSHSSVYFFISFLFISKPTEQTVDNVCGIPLFQIFP